MDYSYEQINSLIKENKKRFAGLSEEAALQIEKRDKSEMVDNEYHRMQQKSEVQIGRLRQRITTIDEKLEKNQPRIVVPKTTERVGISAPGGGSSTRRKVMKIKNLLNGLRSKSQAENEDLAEPIMETNEVALEDTRRSEYSSDSKEEVKMAVERDQYKK